MRNLLIVSCLIIFGQSAMGLTHTERVARRYTKLFIERSQTIQDMAYQADNALNYRLKETSEKMRSMGMPEISEEIDTGWKEFHGTLPILIAKGSRNIGDYKPMFEFIDSIETKLEIILGWELANSLRITDLKAINHEIPFLLFEPCINGLAEYTAHFCGDKHNSNGVPLHSYRGFMPVLAFYSTTISCSIATAGLGLIGFVCGPAAAITEWAVDQSVAPWLAPRFYQAFCGSN